MNLGLTHTPATYDPTLDEALPIEVMKAVQTIQDWAEKNAHESFEIGTICSRDHAYRLHDIVKLLITES